MLPPRMPSLPSVLVLPVPPVVVPPVVSAPSVTLSPMPETALPPMVTGMLTGRPMMLPPPMASVPSVEALPVTVEPVVPPVVSAPSVTLSPMPETALPPTVTGTPTGRPMTLPPPMASVPSVRLPPVEPEPAAVPPVVSASFEALSPITETAFPPTVTGRPIGASTTLPPRIPSVPSVTVPPPVEPEVPPPVVPALSVLLSPITETALPPTVTGASIEMTPWLPPATLSLPSVLLPAAGAAASVAGAEVPASVLLLSPTSETALPPTVTGTSIDTSPWLPEPTPSLPSVMVTGAGAGGPREGGVGTFAAAVSEHRDGVAADGDREVHRDTDLVARKQTVDARGVCGIGDAGSEDGEAASDERAQKDTRVDLAHESFSCR